MLVTRPILKTAVNLDCGLLGIFLTIAVGAAFGYLPGGRAGVVLNCFAKVGLQTSGKSIWKVSLLFCQNCAWHFARTLFPYSPVCGAPVYTLSRPDQIYETSSAV